MYEKILTTDTVHALSFTDRHSALSISFSSEAADVRRSRRVVAFASKADQTRETRDGNLEFRCTQAGIKLKFLG